MLERLAEGAVTLTAVRLLAPHLTPDNAGALLDAVRHRSKRDVELVVAGLDPQPLVPASVRKLPARSAASAPPVTQPQTAAASPLLVASHPGQPCERPGTAPPPPAASPAIVRPLAPERYRIQFTASPEMVDRLRRAQDLLRHTIPSGDSAAVFDRALTVLVAQLEKTVCAATDRPRRASSPARQSRLIPAAVRRAVWTRDGGRCTFTGTEGRCRERGFLQFHHLMPYALGGTASVDNITLRCGPHNRYEAELEFGGGDSPAALLGSSRQTQPGAFRMVSSSRRPALRS